MTFLLVRVGQVIAAVAAWRLTQSSMASWRIGVPRRVGNTGLPGPPGFSPSHAARTATVLRSSGVTRSFLPLPWH